MFNRAFCAIALLWSGGPSLFAATEGFGPDVEPRSWAYQYVFATADSAREVEPLLDQLRNDEALADLMGDYVAEALASPVNSAMEPEARFLLARYLAFRGSDRYLLTFGALPIQPASYDLESLRARYKKRNGRSSAVQYQPGTLDFAKMRAKFAADALAFTPTDDFARKLATLPLDSSLERLFALAGRPQAVISGQSKSGDGVFLNVRIRRLAAYYRGIGRVVFVLRKGQWRSESIVIDPDAFEALMPYRAELVSRDASADEKLELTQLLSGHSAAMKAAIDTRRRAGGASPAFMDAMAETLLRLHSSASTPREFDTFAWMCRLLNSHGGPRYAGVLSTVARETGDEKLRRFASLPAENPPGANPASYVPGSAGLAELRAKYPPLYPERTFLSGEL
jgi:hypothetical protein